MYQQDEQLPLPSIFNYLIVCGTAPGLLFHFSDNTPLTKSKFTAKFSELLSLAGIDSKLYAGHSFRIGASSTAAAKGIEDSLIQTLGRWKSSAYLTYAHLPAENLSTPSCIEFELYNKYVHVPVPSYTALHYSMFSPQWYTP